MKNYIQLYLHLSKLLLLLNYFLIIYLNEQLICSFFIYLLFKILIRIIIKPNN